MFEVALESMGLSVKISGPGKITSKLSVKFCDTYHSDGGTL